MAYCDRYGRHIRFGDVVAVRITNRDTYKGFEFAVYVVKRLSPHEYEDANHRTLVLDGVYGWSELRNVAPSEMAKIDGTVDLRKIECDFMRDRAP